MLRQFLNQIATYSRSKPSTSAAAYGLHGNDISSLVLVSQEDIYRSGRGHEPVLLLSKGQEVSTRDLPRLMQNGVEPTQFRFKTPPRAAIPKGMPQMLPTLHEKNQNATLRVVVLEDDSKSLKRAIDCLFACGFTLNRIHPLRIPAHLGWALDKYKADLLVTDTHILYRALSLDPSLRDTAFPNRILLTKESAHDSYQEEMFADIMSVIGKHTKFMAQTLPKPLNRFGMNNALQVELEPVETGGDISASTEQTVNPEPEESVTELNPYTSHPAKKADVISIDNPKQSNPGYERPARLKIG